MHCRQNEKNRALKICSRVSGANIGDTCPRPMNAAVRALGADLKTKKANAQVNRQKCGAFLSALNLQLDRIRSFGTSFHFR
jgi:hypothetical protein